MSDVFISYAREDRQQAAWLAAVLAAHGWSVFWDSNIPAGKRWDEVIESELDAARSVVVLWSDDAVASPNVNAEAHEGLTRAVLVPAMLEDVRLPLSFRQIQAASLQGWSGDAAHAGVVAVLRALSALLGEPVAAGGDDNVPASPAETTAVESATTRTPADGGGRAAGPPSPTRRRLVAGLLAVLVAAGAGALWWSGVFGPPGVTAEPVMVTVPAGRLGMGSSDAEGGFNDEQPVHAVAFAKPFAIGRYPVTFDQYDEFAVATARAAPDDQGWGRGARPVVDVTWQDASDYAAWLSEQTGRRFRLASEAEWEYAARAGTKTRYWWGEDVRRGDTAMANCDGCGSEWGGEKTAPVGQFEANAFGLHDMHGNVWEWVRDCSHNDYAQAPVDGGAWLEEGGGDCAVRILRGGSWSGKPAGIRSAVRGSAAVLDLADSIGFRLAEDP